MSSRNARFHALTDPQPTRPRRACRQDDHASAPARRTSTPASDLASDEAEQSDHRPAKKSKRSTTKDKNDTGVKRKRKGKKKQKEADAEDAAASGGDGSGNEDDEEAAPKQKVTLVSASPSIL